MLNAEGKRVRDDRTVNLVFMNMMRQTRSTSLIISLDLNDRLGEA